jgi:hypothetical protein
MVDAEQCPKLSVFTMRRLTYPNWSIVRPMGKKSLLPRMGPRSRGWFHWQKKASHANRRALWG